MAKGPGKYDDLCTIVRERANAMGACVLVVNGEHGTGFAVQVVHPDIAKSLPEMLEWVAAEIRRTENPPS